MKHIHGVMTVTQTRIQMSGAAEQPKVDRPIRLVTEVAHPPAGGLQPVLSAQGSAKQGYGQTAHEEGHKYKRSFLKIHFVSLL